jgi:hypothetical protein
MKKHLRRLGTFSRRIGRGLHVEWKETLEIPSLIRRREYKKAGGQVADIAKMATLTLVWIVPGGAVITAMLVKFSHKVRPSAFHSDTAASTPKNDSDESNTL